MRLPTEAEKRLYREATGREAPWCVLVRCWVPGWGIGMSLGPLVLHETLRPEIIVHEMVHVAQFYRQPFTFWLRYLWQLFTKGYRGIDYEVEAYAVQERAKEIIA